MNHNELVKRVVKWLRKSCGCGFAFSELSAYTYTGEIPDAIGWRGGISILVECKTSRADFHADKKKLFRKFPNKGMGKHRYYLCPPNIIEPNDLPYGWGLLYCYPKKIKKVVDPVKGNCNWYLKQFKSNELAEIQLLCSALRRVELRDDLKKIYNMPKT